MTDKPAKGNGVSWQTVVLTVSLAVIAALPPTITAIGARDEAKLARLEAYAAKTQAEETHKAVNSQLDKMLPLIEKGAADKATLTEKAAQQTREGQAAIDAAKTARK